MNQLDWKTTRTIQLVKAYHSYTKDDGTKMREYHIDSHPVLMEYVHNPTMRGDLSVRNSDMDRPVIIIGQDKCVINNTNSDQKLGIVKTEKRNCCQNQIGTV